MANDTISLAGKVAIVTGSGRSKGIGAAIAHALARNGAAVTISYVSESSAPLAADVVQSLRATGAKAIAVQADVTKPEGAKKLVDETLAGFDTKEIHILVNNVGNGSGQGTLAVDMGTDAINRAFAGNVFASWYVTQAVVPYMPSGGRIVNIGTVVSRLSNLPGVSAYGAAKAAQDYLTGALALELGRERGITVNTIAPGGTITDAQGWFPPGELRDQVGATLVGMTKLGARLGQPEEIADAVLLVVSDQARWITGQHISVSGGI